jgi:hypothetical protein
LTAAGGDRHRERATKIVFGPIRVGEIIEGRDRFPFLGINLECVFEIVDDLLPSMFSFVGASRLGGRFVFLSSVDH